jgi:hypothetical protein
MVSRFLKRAVPAIDAQQRIDDQRFAGYAGGTIKMHRAFLTMPLRQIDMASALVLPLAFDTLLLFLTDPLLELWHVMLVFLTGRLGLDTIVSARTMDLGPVLVAVPNIEMTVASPTSFGLFMTFLGTLVIWLATMLMKPDHYLPIIYFLRAMVIVMWTSLLYFAFFSAVIPIQLTDYMGKSLAASYVLIALVPWLFGIALYIFNFSLLHKIGVTLLTMVYLALFVPMQYLLQLVIFHYGSILYLPLGFMAFGVFLDVFLIVAFYGWGMTWSNKASAPRQA